ncbi:hypothetical protein QAD02_015881 [Eretmocerus hayati]|uniref:Uncharacterized protein n=1 Tax=Eretmocerus hayati TaxID=131215 RepID=A0ACC2P908_9HYME|nr:hypothetical protein QAD02_015881 [Eretmocerus hayati]
MTNEEEEQTYEEAEQNEKEDLLEENNNKKRRGRPPKNRQKFEEAGSIEKFVVQGNSSYKDAFTPSATLQRSPRPRKTATTVQGSRSRSLENLIENDVNPHTQAKKDIHTHNGMEDPTRTESVAAVGKAGIIDEGYRVRKESYSTDQNDNIERHTPSDQLILSRIEKLEARLQDMRIDRELDKLEIQRWKDQSSKSDTDRQNEKNEYNNIIAGLEKRIQTMEEIVRRERVWRTETENKLEDPCSEAQHSVFEFFGQYKWTSQSSGQL